MMHPPPLLPPQSEWKTLSTPHRPMQQSCSTARLRLSAYDPRAVGGRQTVRLSLEKEFAEGLDNLELRVRCDLLPMKTSQYRFIRALSGEWQSVLLSFSSRNKEHGQYPLEMELRFHHEKTCVKRWLCSTVLLLPRGDASLSEIHQVFLASQKHVRVIAEDGAIAKLQHQPFGGAQHRQLNVEVIARDASIAQLALPSTADHGQSDVAPGYLAWEEDLVEVAAQTITQEQALQQEYQQKHLTHASAVDEPSCASEDTVTSTNTTPSTNSIAIASTTSAITLVPQQTIEATPTADKLACAYYHPIRHHCLRIIGGNVANTWRIGRVISADINLQNTLPDIQIAHPRVSASHATLQRRNGNMELIDHSRYGILLNDQRVAPLQAMQLHIGDRIDFCASFAGTLVWQVIAFDHRMLILQHSTEHGNFETLCLVFQESTRSQPNSVDITQHIKRLQIQTQARGIPDFTNTTATDNTGIWTRFEQSYPHSN